MEICYRNVKLIEDVDLVIANLYQAMKGSLWI